MAYKWSSSVLTIALGVLFVAGCDESLPPRSDPTNILQPSLIPPHDIIEMQDGMPIRSAGAFSASLKNTYSEVLEKEADIQVSISVWMATSSEVHRTIRLTSTSLTYPVLRGNMLTLLPRDSARFFGWWDQRTDDGVPFWNYVRLTEKIGANGEPYKDSDPIEMVAQVSMQVFKNVQPRTGPPIHFTVMYRLFSSTSDGNN